MRKRIDKGCSSCARLVQIGERDYICGCDERRVVVLADFMPSDDYFWCKGKKFISIR